MATLDQILLRLPRKVPDAGFVDKLFGQIQGKGTSTPAPSITDQDLFLLGPNWVESDKLAMQEDIGFMQTDANFHLPPVMQKQSSLDIYQFAKLSPPNLTDSVYERRNIL